MQEHRCVTVDGEVMDRFRAHFVDTGVKHTVHIMSININGKPDKLESDCYKYYTRI